MWSRYLNQLALLALLAAPLPLCQFASVLHATEAQSTSPAKCPCCQHDVDESDGEEPDCPDKHPSRPGQCPLCAAHAVTAVITVNPAITITVLSKPCHFLQASPRPDAGNREAIHRPPRHV